LVVDELGKIIFYNRGAETIFGYKPDEITGRSVTGLISEQVGEEGPQAVGGGGADATLTTRSRVQLMSGRRKSGEDIPLEVSVSSWRSGNGRLHSVIARDVSEARKAKEREERQARLAAVGQLAAGIAHDFNNTLNAIILYAEMLGQREHLTEGDRRLLDVIRQQSDRASKLVTQILDFSRKSLLEPKPLELVAFLQEMESMVKRMLPENIEVVLDIEPHRITVEADLARLQQVIMNLTINAKDAMRSGGRLTYRLSSMEVLAGDSSREDSLPPGSWAVIAVRDTGGGIEPAHLAHIFEPFFTTKDPGEGTGLGLAQAYGIIEQHGGQIRVESAIDEGAQFSIYLPRVEVEEVTREGEEAPRGGNHETILLIEDEEAIREGMAEILRGLRYCVLTAGDAETALALFSQHAQSIEVVITDMVLPDMHGNEIIDRLSNLKPELSVILMTGYPLGKGTKELQSKSVSIRLQKPISRKALGDAVNEVLEGMSRSVTL
jgi:PAS domain S-box-containing protein